MINDYIKGLLLIFAAEMGDKTQILAMTFATQYTIKQVLGGVFAGSFLNHAIAVSIGAYLSQLIPFEKMQIFAGILFVIFALWNLKAEEDEEENNKKYISPMMTVAIAFFIGELGDKTQLAAITLGADATYPFATLLGTVSGMVVTSSLGIFIGLKLGEKIPEFTIKLASSMIFFGFGVFKLYSSLPATFINPLSIVVFLSTIFILTYVLLQPQLEARQKGYISRFRKASIDLYRSKEGINESINKICLTENSCVHCEGKKCIINNLKDMLETEQILDFNGEYQEKFNISDVKFALIKILIFLNHSEQGSKDFELYNDMRTKLEMIIFNRQFDFKNVDDYFQQLKASGYQKTDELIRLYEDEINQV